MTSHPLPMRPHPLQGRLHEVLRQLLITGEHPRGAQQGTLARSDIVAQPGRLLRHFTPAIGSRYLHRSDAGKGCQVAQVSGSQRFGAGMRAGGRSLGAGMRIALVGTGRIGSTLGQKWQQAGHEVVYGSRNPSPDGGPGGAPSVTVGAAIAGSQVVVFAIPGPAVADVATEHGAALAGKIVVDATNRVGQPVVNNHDGIVATAPGALYARAFNTLGWENFAEPLADADLFFAADPEARATVELLITAVGLRPQYVGGADAVETVDSVLSLWFALVKQHGGNRKLALRVVE